MRALPEAPHDETRVSFMAEADDEQIPREISGELVIAISVDVELSELERGDESSEAVGVL